MGISPMEYVVRVRTQDAIFMLRETNDRVSMIAKRVGFYDGPHLAMTLRRRGLGRPSNFRQFWRRRIFHSFRRIFQTLAPYRRFPLTSPRGYPKVRTAKRRPLR